MFNNISKYLLTYGKLQIKNSGRLFMVQMALSSSMTVLENVVGFEDRKNTILHTAPTSCNTDSQIEEKPASHVILFPGDLQDFEDKMLEHPNSKDWVEFSYEKVSEVFSRKFPDSHIWIISPSKKIYKIICIFKNFVKSESLFGVPEYTNDYNGLAHLEILFKNAQKLIFKDRELSGHDSTIKLAAFSKGCIVLNQFLYEVAALSQKENNDTENSNIISFVNRITTLYWLDGGHSGEKDVWVKDRDVLRSLKTGKWRNDIKIFVHVTPYQIKDKIHPWKGQEEEQFVSGLKEVGVDFVEKLHFDTGDNEEEIVDREILLRKHFEVMHVF